MRKKILLSVLFAISMIVIAVGAFLLKHEKKPTEIAKLSDFKDMLGKRVAFWGIVNRREIPCEFPHVLIFGESKLRMDFYFVSASSSKKFHDDGHLIFGSPNPTRCIYVSGVIVYEYVDLEKDKQFKQELLNGYWQMPFPSKNGQFWGAPIK